METEQHLAGISARAERLLAGLPAGVELVAAAKGRAAPEVAAAIRGGITRVGHNYVQEARAMQAALQPSPTWHMIGHLQRNKARQAVRLFDVVETVDSWPLAQELDARCRAVERVLPVLIEVNSAGEAGKAGVPPEEVAALARRVAELDHLRLDGLMTMGPAGAGPEELRPFFRATRELGERVREALGGRAGAGVLSMGMSDSYVVAVEEGATAVRIGTLLFGPRPGA